MPGPCRLSSGVKFENNHFSKNDKNFVKFQVAAVVWNYLATRSPRFGFRGDLMIRSRFGSAILTRPRPQVPVSTGPGPVRGTADGPTEAGSKKSPIFGDFWHQIMVWPYGQTMIWRTKMAPKGSFWTSSYEEFWSPKLFVSEALKWPL